METVIHKCPDCPHCTTGRTKICAWATKSIEDVSSSPPEWCPARKAKAKHLIIL